MSFKKFHKVQVGRWRQVATGGDRVATGGDRVATRGGAQKKI